MTAAQTTDTVITAIQNMEYPVQVTLRGKNPEESPMPRGPLGVLEVLDDGGKFDLVGCNGAELTVIADGGAEDLTIG